VVASTSPPVVVVSPSEPVVDVVLAVLPVLSPFSLAEAAEGSSRTKRYVKATIASTTRGNIQRPGLGS
jgi:hypothetical protein